ncbi:MAG: Uma2 family endonuclease [Cyanobacterium sp.]
MVIITDIKPQLTLEEFLKLPETKPYSEYFKGNIYQKTMPQGEHSIIQTSLSTKINEVAKPQKVALALTELRCNFGNQSIVPDISVFIWDRIPKNERGKIVNRFNIHSDWVIEILSPKQSTNKVIRKIMFCLDQGTQLAWLIDPEDESVMIFKPEQVPEIKSDEEILPVLDTLKNLQLSVKEMFSWFSIN